MKFSISVKDEVWRQVAANPSQGPSEIVQQALLALVAEQRRDSSPMANAPDPAQLDRYRPAFDEAVAKVATTIREVQDSGYRFGMLLAPALAMTDFDVLDQTAVAAAQIKQLLEGILGTGGAEAERPEDLFSDSLYDRCTTLLEAHVDLGSDRTRLQADMAPMLGSPDSPVPGVRWVEDVHGEHPMISDTFARSVADAFRDVRDESLRRIRGQQTDAPAGS